MSRRLVVLSNHTPLVRVVAPSTTIGSDRPSGVDSSAVVVAVP
ncbi:hypothetical protein ACIA8K_38445 [Catenuloplanes sp. NPDC051500]